MHHLTFRRWCSSPIVSIILLLVTSCSPKTELASDAGDTTAVNEDYADSALEDAWENGTLGDGRPPQEGIWTYQATWMSQAFYDEFTRTLNVDSAVKADPLPVAYFDFTSGDSYLGLFDFTTFLANGAPAEQMLWDGFDISDSENEISARIQKSEKNLRGVSRIELVRRNDYDDDKDGIVDDLETLVIKFYKGDKLVETRNYFKTYRSPDEIAHTIQLAGSYVDAQGGVYTFDRGDSPVPDRYKQCSNYLATQECWAYTRFRLTSPELTFDYVLLPDEGGNDYIMMGENEGYAYARKGDSLTVYVREGIYKLVKKK